MKKKYFIEKEKIEFFNEDLICYSIGTSFLIIMIANICFPIPKLLEYNLYSVLILVIGMLGFYILIGLVIHTILFLIKNLFSKRYIEIK